MEQVVVTNWKNGKIIHERFYYDAGKTLEAVDTF
jgi:hypothetical protein